MSEREQEEQLKAKYGGLPTQKGLLARRLKGGDRKYFDSADWAQEKSAPKPALTPSPAVTNAGSPMTSDRPSAPPRLGPR